MTRFALDRTMVSVDAFDRSVAVKVGYLDGAVVNVYPEYEHCKVRRELCIHLALNQPRLTQIFLQAIALEKKLPLLQVIQRVQELARDHLNVQSEQRGGA